MTDKSFVPYLALLFVQLLFGLNFPASKIILDQVPPILWSAIRMGIAAILMFITAFLIVPRADRKMDTRFLQKTFIYGFFGIVLSQTFFMMGLKNTTATNGAVLNTLIPIFTLMISILFRTEKFTLNRAFGFLIAVIGVLVLRKIEDFSASMEHFLGDLFMILNCVSLAIFFNISREFLKANSAYWVTAWMFLFGSLVIGLFCLNDLHFVFEVTLDSTVVWAMAFNIVCATMLTYFLNSWTLKRVSASSVAVFVYFQPAIAVAYAWMVQNEIPSIRTLIAVTCIFVGVLVGIVQKPIKRGLPEVGPI